MGSTEETKPVTSHGEGLHEAGQAKGLCVCHHNPLAGV